MWNSLYRYTDCKDECVENPLEKYKTGDWLKKMHEKIDREKEKIQREKKRADRESQRRMRREERMERAIATSKEIFWADLRKAQEKYKAKNAENKEKLGEIEKSEEKEKQETVQKRSTQLEEKSSSNEGKSSKDEVKYLGDKCKESEGIFEKEFIGFYSNPLFASGYSLYSNPLFSCDDSLSKEFEEVFSKEESRVFDIIEFGFQKTEVPQNLEEAGGSSMIHQEPIEFQEVNDGLKKTKEGNEVNEREYSLVVASHCELEKYGYVSESKGGKGQANSSNELAIFSIGMVAYSEFLRLIFDPGDNGARNSWTNSLEEGGNDGNLGWVLLK